MTGTYHTPESSSSLLLDVLFGLTIAALFSGLNWRLGGIKVQLADLLSLISVFVVMLRGFVTPRIALTLVVFLSAYLLIFCVSGFSVSVVNGLKELVQAALALLFLLAIFGHYRSHSSERFLLIATALMVAVMMYNIGWHISEGFYVGWKRLNEPKAIFVVLPLLLMILFDRFGRHRRTLFIGASVIAAALILLSGERKAYLIAVLALAVWTGVSSLRYLAVAALVTPLLLPIAALDEGGYVHRQLESFSSALTNRAEQASTSELFEVGRAATLSDAQREFTHRIARSMWEKQPIFGIGTGAYDIAMQRYSSLPDAFRVGIHGEFYRALFENGIVGLAFYIAYWIAVALSLTFAWQSGNSMGNRNLSRIKLLCTVTFFIYCSAEASKGLTILCLCALPFVLAVRARHAVGRDLERAAGGWRLLA